MENALLTDIAQEPDARTLPGYVDNAMLAEKLGEEGGAQN